MPVGVPQGSILGPVLFLIYVNDLPNCPLASDIVLNYADDTVLYYSSKDLSDLQRHLNVNLGCVPLGGSGSGFVILDHSDHGALKERGF